MQRVFVTGGAGFIGSYTVNLLLKSGKQVLVLDNLVTGKRENLDWSHPNLSFVQADVLDYSVICTLIRDCDAVLHLAALPSVQKSIENPILSCQVNTQGFLNVLQAIREVNRQIRLIYASSAAVYGSNEILPCSDEAPITPELLSPYALEKATNERYADLYYRLFGIRSLGLRYFNVYGIGQDPQSVYAGVIARFLHQYQNHEPIVVFGDGQQSRDFIHVLDVAKANQMALESEYVGVVNIATGISETLLNLIRYIEQVGGYPANVHFGQRRSGDIMGSYAKIDKAREQLGFHYTTSLSQGMASLVEKKLDLKEFYAANP